MISVICLQLSFTLEKNEPKKKKKKISTIYNFRTMCKVKKRFIEYKKKKKKQSSGK